MRFKKIFAVVMAAAVTLSTLNGFHGFSAPKTAKAASFVNLNQSQITSAMGAGWNHGNQLEASLNGTPNETSWGNPTINANLIKAVQNAGFRSIRIPVSYLGKIGSNSSYTIDSSWLNRVQQVVDMCIANDLYVIINMHGDGYHSVDGGWLFCDGSNQTAIRAKYKACWKQIATRFQSYDQHLIFESMNEEFDGTYGTPNRTYYENINQLNQIFVDTVRTSGGNNAKRWLMLPGWNTNVNYTVGDYGFRVPTDNNCTAGGKRIMISVHYYDPWGFCGEESTTATQWGSKANNSSKVDSWGDESYLKSQFNSLYNKFCSQGYPVVIGEYGAIDKSAFDSNNTACRAEFASKVCTYAKKYGCIPIWWDNGVTGTYGFGLFNRNTGAVTQPKIINAITAVYPSSGNNSDSTGSIDTGKTYMLKNVNSGLYMDVCGAKAVNGTNVILYSASKAKANNTLKFVPDGKGYYYIYSCLGDGRTFLLDVSCNSSANGTNIGIYKNTNCSAQLYKLVKNSDGSYSIYTKSSGCKSVVEIANANRSNNGNVQQWVYNGHNCQKWQLIAQ